MVIAEAPPVYALPMQWLALRVDDHEEVGRALVLLAQPSIEGIHLYSGNGVNMWDLFQGGYTLVQAAGGLVLDEQGRLLAMRRLGKWDLPKGKVDHGEGIPEAALREVREECGMVELELLRPLTSTWHTYTHKGSHFLKRTDWFVMRANSSDALIPEHAEGIEEVRWLNATEVERMRAETYTSLLPLLRMWETLPERQVH